jgi:myosin-crossreactive antigen
MNTWYTTNKAAIDSASLAASTQVGPWALWMDMQLAVRSASMHGEPCYSADYTAATTTAVTCTTNNTNVLKYIENLASLCSVIGDFGDSFAIGI